MFSRKKPDVLVVGAGPVGLFTALALTRRGLRARIIEREPRAVTRSYALALHAESLRLLEELDVLRPVLDRAMRVRRVGLYRDGQRMAGLHISDLAEDYSFLAILPQNELETVLVEALAKEGVKVEWNHAIAFLEQQYDHVEVTVDRLAMESIGYSVLHSDWVVASSKRVQVPFVIGADGHRSTVRQRLEVDFPAVGPSQDFAVFEGRSSFDLDDELRLCFDDRGSSLCWPLPDGFCRWSFERHVAGEPADTRRKDREVVQLSVTGDPDLTQDRLRELLVERAPWFEGEVDPIRWRTAVRFPRRLASSFGSNRTWLVGDAGHMTGPAGIQSMNVGLREGMELADAVAATLADPVTRDALERYGAGRVAEWRGLLGLDPLLEVTAETPDWLVHEVGRLLPCLPASGGDLARLAGQVGLRCRAAPPVANA